MFGNHTQPAMKFKRLYRMLAFTVFLLSIIVGCARNARDSGTLEVWAHAGQDSERITLEEQVNRFNAVHDDVTVRLTFLPEGSYNAQVQAAAISQDLPDVLEFDGPFIYNYVWQQNLRPIDDLISAEVRQDLLPSILVQGTYNDRLYSVGTFDSGLGIYGRRSVLESAGIRIPQGNADAWTAQEFNSALATLAANDPDGQVLDLKLNYSGEWFTYAFMPLLYSAGGATIDRTTYQTASGFLDGPDSVVAMEQVQSWMENGYVDPNVDDAAFTTGRVALSWVGHWVYPSYAEALGDDLVVLPLPNLGNGSKTAQGSWNWGITERSHNPQAAMAFLEFLLQQDEVLAMSNANGAVPATQSAIAQSPLYREGGPLRLFSSQLLNNKTVPRPQTPGYPVITSAFQEAFNNIRNGLEVQQALERAATEIDLDIRDNEGYPNVS